jgi:UDP-GlcNAc:undecaprenyl-phosphate GlcNAc-1-phosphate transferase
MFIGYTLALLSIVGTAKVAIALLVLGVPIIDTFWIIVRRLVTGRAPFSPDRGHLHHRLLDLGLSHRQAVLLIYAICVGLAVLAYALSGQGQLYAFLGAFFAIGVLLVLLARQTMESSGLEAESYESDAESGVAVVEPNDADADPAGRPAVRVTPRRVPHR